jgi:hypothetical protein
VVSKHIARFLGRRPMSATHVTAPARRARSWSGRSEPHEESRLRKCSGVL